MRFSGIIDVSNENRDTIGQISELLIAGFPDSSSWRTLEEAVTEVQSSLEPGRISRIAVDCEGKVLGWIAGNEGYGGNAWELHPLIVRQDCRLQGLGRRLVADFEMHVAQRGGHTVWLGTDDQSGRTSLGGIDLYPDVLDKLKALRNLDLHPFEFYLKLGYRIVGVIPDANGFGKPDILMAKRIHA
jgi:aminoglycoside 6'-N-acetyltransferase I